MANMDKPFYVDWARALPSLRITTPGEDEFGEEYFVDPNTATPEQIAAAFTNFEAAVRQAVFQASSATYTYYFDSRYAPGVDLSTLDARHDTFVVVGHEHRNDYIDLSAPLADSDVVIRDETGAEVSAASGGGTRGGTREERIAGSDTDFIVSGTFGGVSYSYTFTFDAAARQYVITNTATGDVVDSTPDRIQYTLDADGNVRDANGDVVTNAEVHYTHIGRLTLENGGKPIAIDFVDGALPAYADIAVALIGTLALPTATSFSVARYGSGGSGFIIKGINAGSKGISASGDETLFTAVSDGGSGYTITDANGDSVATPTNPTAIAVGDGEVSYFHPYEDIDEVSGEDNILSQLIDLHYSGGTYTYTSYGITDGAGAEVAFPLKPVAISTTDFDAATSTTTIPNNGKPITFDTDISAGNAPAYAGIAIALIQGLSGSTATSYTVTGIAGQNPDDPRGFRITDNTGATLFEAAASTRTLPIFPKDDYIGLVYVFGDSDPVRGDGAAYDAAENIRAVIPILPDGTLAERVALEIPFGAPIGDKFGGGARHVTGSTIEGRGGNDDITGTDGDDVIYGDYDHRHLNATDGKDYIRGLGGDDTIRGGGLADYIFGGAGNDYIRGDVGYDFLDGGDDDDIIEGGTGDDHILGGAGDDVLIGGDDRDVIFGEDGNDVLIGGRAAIETTWTIDRLYGGAGDDKLYGNGGDDYLDGGTGDDILDGGPNDDKIRGGLGNDRILMSEGVDAVWGNGIKASYYAINAHGGGVLRLGASEVFSQLQFPSGVLPDLVETMVTHTFYRKNGESFDVSSVFDKYPADLYTQAQIDALTAYWQSETDSDTFVLAFDRTSRGDFYKMTIKDFDPTDIIEYDGDLADLTFRTPAGNFYDTYHESDAVVSTAEDAPNFYLRIAEGGSRTFQNNQHVDIDHPVPHIHISHALGLSVLDVTQYLALEKDDTDLSARLRQDDDDGIYYRDIININEYADDSLVGLGGKGQLNERDGVATPNYLDLRTPTEVDLGNSKTAYIYGFGGAALPRYTDVAVAAIKAELVQNTAHTEFHVVRDDSLGNNWKVIASTSTEEISTGYNTPIVTTLLTGTTTDSGATWSITDSAGGAVTTPTNPPAIARSTGDYVALTIGADWTIGHWEFANQYFDTLDEERQFQQEQSRTQLLTTIKIDAEDLIAYTITNANGDAVAMPSNPPAIVRGAFNNNGGIFNWVQNLNRSITIDRAEDGTLPQYTDIAVELAKGLGATARSYHISAIPDSQASVSGGFQIIGHDGTVLITGTATRAETNFVINNSDLDLDIFEWVERELDNGDKIYELWLANRYALDYETDSSYSVGLTLNRPEGDTITDTIEINVNDLKEANDIFNGRTQIKLSIDHINLQDEVGFTTARKVADITHLGAALEDGHEYMVGNEELFEIRQNQDGGYELWLKGGVRTATIASHDTSVYVGERVAGSPGALPDYTDVAVYLIKSELVEGQTGFNAKSYHVEATADGFIITNARGDVLFTGTESGATYTVVRNADNSAVDITSATIPTITHADGTAGPIDIEVDPATGKPLPNAQLLHSYEIDFEQVVARTYDITRHFGEPVDVSNPDAITFADFEMDTSDGDLFALKQ